MKLRTLFVISILIVLIVLFTLFYPRGSIIHVKVSRNNNLFSEIITIRRILHQSWKDNNVPERFRNYSKSWKEICFKDWNYIFWTDADNLNLIKYHYPWFLNKYNNLPSPIHKADVARYFYMLHYGGLYTDFDNECLRPFEHLLTNYSMVFGAMKDSTNKSILKEGVVQNSFMYSLPNRPFWLEMIMAVLNNPKDEQPEHQTGPVLLAKVLDGLRQRSNNTDLIKIYDPDYFNPFSWIDRTNLNKHCKDYNKMTYEDWQTCKASMVARGSFVVQYHAHTWNYDKSG